jgi:hypothetical protein
MGGDRAAEIAGEQDCAEQRGARPQVEQGRRQQDDAQQARVASIGRPAHRGHRLPHHGQRRQLHPCVHQQEQHDQRRDRAAGQRHPARVVGRLRHHPLLRSFFLSGFYQSAGSGAC